MTAHRMHPFVACTLLVGALVGCEGNRSELPPVHVFIDMDQQQRFDAQERNDFFADHRAMRPPVEGTVAQGQLADDTQLEDGLEQEEEATKTFPASVTEKWDDSVARGLNRYTIYCAPCHGGALDGNGTVAGVALDGGPRFQGVKSLHTEHAAKELRVGELYRIVKNGQNTMPSYAAQIPVADRWAIVAYIRALQASKSGTIDDVPENLREKVREQMRELPKPTADANTPGSVVSSTGGAK
jgi:mono/diheme cytochrome c family protein